MFETAVGTRKLDRGGVELTQQFPPIFQALLSGALGGGSEAPDADGFRRDPLVAPLPDGVRPAGPRLPTQASTSPEETPPSAIAPSEIAPSEIAPPSTLDAALLAAFPMEASPPASRATAEGARLHAVSGSGGAHRAEPHLTGHSRAGRRAARTGAHRAPEAGSEQPDTDRSATGRGGRHRTLRAVAH